MAKPYKADREIAKALKENPRPAEHLGKDFTAADVVKAHAADVTGARKRVVRRKKRKAKKRAK